MTVPVGLTIRVQYSCALCGVQNGSVDVPARMSDDDNVVHWVEQICGNAIGQDHRRRSPTCPARKISEVKIPIDGAERVGGPAIH